MCRDYCTTFLLNCSCFFSSQAGGFTRRFPWFFLGITGSKTRGVGVFDPQVDFRFLDSLVGILELIRVVPVRIMGISGMVTTNKRPFLRDDPQSPSPKLTAIDAKPLKIGLLPQKEAGSSSKHMIFRGYISYRECIVLYSHHFPLK